MSNLLSNPFIKYSLLVIYILAQGFFLGLAINWTLPMPGLPWPYYVIIGYSLGVILSVLITYLVFKKWQTSLTKKVIVAVILLILIAVASIAIASWELYLLKLRANEIFGS